VKNITLVDDFFADFDPISAKFAIKIFDRDFSPHQEFVICNSKLPPQIASGAFSYIPHTCIPSQ
jgi:hypothetical protein